MGKPLGEGIDPIMSRIKVCLQRCLIQCFRRSFVLDPLGSKPAGNMVLPPFPQNARENAVFRKPKALALIQHHDNRAAGLTPTELL